MYAEDNVQSDKQHLYVNGIRMKIVCKWRPAKRRDNGRRLCYVYTDKENQVLSIAKQSLFTCVLESGRAHQNSPFRLSSAIFWLSLWASTTVSGMHSSVSSVA